MRLSIIVVNWKVRDLLRTCLLSVRREMLLPAEDYELIVVDNASHDGSVEMLRAEFPDVTLIESPVNLGFGAGCNRAYAVCSGDFVLLLNPDTVVIDHALDGLLGVLQAHPRAAIVAPRLVNPDRTFQRASGGALPTLRNVAWNYLFLAQLLPRRWAPPALFLAGDPPLMVEVEWVSGASMMLRRAAAGATIFDEAYFMFGEDMDVCDRVRSDGWQVLYVPEHAIVHHHGKSFDQQVSAEVRAAAHRGPRRVFAKRHGPLALWAYDAILVAGFGLRWPVYALLARLRPGRGYAARAAFSRAYLQALWRMRGEPDPPPQTRD